MSHLDQIQYHYDTKALSALYDKNSFGWRTTSQSKSHWDTKRGFPRCQLVVFHTIQGLVDGTLKSLSNSVPWRGRLACMVTKDDFSIEGSITYYKREHEGIITSHLEQVIGALEMAHGGAKGPIEIRIEFIQTCEIKN